MSCFDSYFDSQVDSSSLFDSYFVELMYLTTRHFRRDVSGSEAKAMFRQFFGREPDGNVSALTLVDMSDRHVWNPVTTVVVFSGKMVPSTCLIPPLKEPEPFKRGYTVYPINTWVVATQTCFISPGSLGKWSNLTCAYLFNWVETQPPTRWDKLPTSTG